MRRLLPLLPLLLFAASCSKDADNPVVPPVNDARGTAVGPDHVFSHASPLVWSQATNEVIGFSSSTPAAGTGLLALSVGDGVVRVLDPATPQALALSPDGAAVYYAVDLPPASGDTVVLLRRPLAGGAPELLGSAPDGTPISFVLSLDGDWLAWGRAGSDPLEPGTLTLRHLTTGDTIEVGAGSPVAMASDGSQIVYRPDPTSPALRKWTRATRQDADFDPAFPIGSGPPTWRWSGSDPSTLNDRGSPAHMVALRQFLPSGDTDFPSFSSADEIVVGPPFWSPDGSRGAAWTRRPSASGNYSTYMLNVFDLPVGVGVVVASGIDEPGGATFSSDASRIAQLFGERLFVSNAATTPGVAVAARGSRAP